MLVRITGKVEKTGSAMISNAALVVNLEAHEAPGHMFVTIAARVVAIEHARARVIRRGNRRRRLDGSQLILELLNTLLETLSVRQSRVSIKV